MAKNQIIYEIQGSAPEPYTVNITISPLEISCTCTAGENGIPCKHRTTILYGSDPGITSGDKSKLADINHAAETSGVFGALENYENARNERKNTLKRVDYNFKKYREARESYALKSVKTDKAVIKCRETLEISIDESIEAEKVVKKALKSLQAVYTKPVYTNTKKSAKSLAEQAAAEVK